MLATHGSAAGRANAASRTELQSERSGLCRVLPRSRRANLGTGYAVLTALTVGEEVVATLLGIRNGSRYVMVRFSNAGENGRAARPACW